MRKAKLHPAVGRFADVTANADLQIQQLPPEQSRLAASALGHSHVYPLLQGLAQPLEDAYCCS